MKKLLLFLAVMTGLLVFSNQTNAQFVVHPYGNADLGPNPFDPEHPNMPQQFTHWLDTVSVLRIYGRYGENAAGSHMTFGDTYLYNTFNVALGELGYSDSDRLWLQGKFGTYLTAGGNAEDTVMYYDPIRANAVKINKDVHTSGVFVQSDERFKENIEPVNNVLSSLEALEAVSYTLKSNSVGCRKANAAMPVYTDKAKRDKEFFDKFYGQNEIGSERYGFIAQNVQDVFPQLVHTDNEGYMYVDYIGLIPILVQSINELRAELAAVKGEQEVEAAPVLKALAASQSEQEMSMNNAKLYQNAPNPWNSETVIRYCLPQGIVEADIYIYDMQGTQMRHIPADGRGESQVTITSNELKAGMYIYALIADGTLVDSKKMILTK